MGVLRHWHFVVVGMEVGEGFGGAVGTAVVVLVDVVTGMVVEVDDVVVVAVADNCFGVVESCL